MITPIKPVQDCEKGSKARKVAKIATGVVATAGVALTVAAAIKGKETQGNLFNKVATGYKEIYNAAKAFVKAKGTIIAQKSQEVFEAVKKFATEKGTKLKEKAQTLLASLKEKLPQKAQKVEEAFEEGAGI